MDDQELNPQKRREKRRRHELIMKSIISMLLLLVLVMVVLLVKEVVLPRLSTSTTKETAVMTADNGTDTAGTVANDDGNNAAATVTVTDDGNGNTATVTDADAVTVTDDDDDGNGDEVAVTDDDRDAALETEDAAALLEAAEDAVLLEAEALAAMYDYDGAIATVQACEYYEQSELLQQACTSYEKTKANCVAWSADCVTHIFFHIIIWDATKAFDGDLDAEGYNQYFVTMDEFAAIMETMYAEGYVMVSMHDMCDIAEDGTVTAKEILLPAGKTPFVLSQDDLSYYHYMDGDGFASRLILDENGDVKNEYIEDDGTVSVGDYDLVPWIDTFVAKHPDFAYCGHKGTIALTGYEGILGYRTDEVYLTQDEDRLTSWQTEWLAANPDFDEEAWQAEVDAATAVAEAMKANGWEFASHTWGHIDPLAKGYDGTVQDTERWLSNVATIVGDTDIIIFAFGADINDWTEYSEDNEYYRYLKEQGFSIYCCVDSSTYYVQFNGTSMRMGRRNIDGYRMYYNPDYLTDLFSVSSIWDSLRPDSVTEIGSTAGVMSNMSTDASAEEAVAENTWEE